jgi:hypothetical protein
MVMVPAGRGGLPPTKLDIRTATEVERGMNERAQRLATHGVAVARHAPCLVVVRGLGRR